MSFGSNILETVEWGTAATNWTQPVNDSVTPSDAIAFDRALNPADSVTLADAQALGRGIQVADSVTASDSAATQTGKGVTVNDSVTPTDAQTFDRGLGLADTATPSDAQAFDRVLSQADTVTLADAQRLDRALLVAETVALADSTAANRGIARRIGDIVPTTDGTYGRKGMRLDAALSLATMQTRLNALKADGVEHVRASAAWPTLNPSSGTFVWTTTDNVINEATARGMTVSLSCDGMPGWVNPNGFWVPPRSAGELSSWQTFAQTMAARYAGQGVIYECWNEPDQSAFWLDPTGTFGAPDPTEYAPVLRSFYLGIKAGDANGQVGGMVVNRTRLGYIGAVYDALESQFGVATCQANNYFFDLLALHPYCLTHPPDFATSDDTTDTWGVVARRFLDFSRGYDLVYTREGVHKMLIFGEFGYSTVSGSNGPITDATRATYVPLAYQGIRAAGYVHSLTWFTYADASNAGFDIQGTTSETAYTAVATTDAVLTIATGKGVSLADTLSLADAFSFDRTLSAADAVSLADAITQQRGLGLADSVSPSDALQFDRALTVAEAVALVDAIIETPGVGWTATVGDTVTLADSAQTAFDAHLSVADSVTLADAQAFSRGYGLSLADTLALADAVALNRGVAVTIADTLATADAFRFDRAMFIADLVTLADSQFFGLPGRPVTTSRTRVITTRHGRTGARSGQGATLVGGGTGRTGT